MGYESRIFIARKCKWGRADESKYICSIELARMNLSSMPNGFDRLFTEAVNWKLLGDNETDLSIDCYGDTCTYTSDIQSVIDFLEECEQKEHYRRITPALAMLKAYAAENWDGELIIIHYGY